MFEISTYTIAEAAQWLTGHSKDNSPKTERHVLNLAVKQMLPICFHFEGELFNVSIKRGDVKVTGGLIIPFNGLLRSLDQPKSSEDYLTATLCQIVSVDSMKFERKNGICTKGYKLPTEYNHGGDVKAGYLIEGRADFIDIPRTDWLFHIDDLNRLIADDINKVQVSSTTQANSVNGKNKASLNNKEMWVAEAWKQGLFYMEAWRKAGYEPTVANIGLYVESVFSNNGIHNTNGNIIDRATIVREALTGITGHRQGYKSKKPKIPDGEVGKLPQK